MLAPCLPSSHACAWQPSARLLPCGCRGNAGARRAVIAAATKARSAREVACSKTLVTTPKNADAVAQLCQSVAEFSRAQPRACGVVEFSVMRDSFEPATFHFFERYESNTALGRHNTTPQVEAFMRQVVPLLQGPVQMCLYEVRDGQLGPVSMQSGPKGEGGLDDATGASGTAGGAGMKQTSRLALLTTVEDVPEAAAQPGAAASRAPGSSSSPAPWQHPGVLAAAGLAAALLGFALLGH